jgi:asparagine synthase (glutamine-hydrolysing)
MFSPVAAEISHVWSRDIFENVFKNHQNTLSRPEDYVNHSLYFEAKTFLHGLFIVEDKLSMAHGLETRVPFMDNDLVDFASRLPVNLKVRNLARNERINENTQENKKNLYHSITSDGKYLLRKTMENYVSDDIAKGAKKGFSSPDGSWFRGDSIEFVKKTLCLPKNPLYELLDYKEVQQKLQLHFDGRENKRLLIWSLLYLSTYLGDR